MEKKQTKVTQVKEAPVKTAPVKAAVPVKAEEAVKEVQKDTVVNTQMKLDEMPKKAAPEKEAPKKETVKKAPVKKAVEKKPEGIAEEIYVQYLEKEVITSEVLERAKQDYIADGHRESSIKSIHLYIKPEENMAYYVINEKIAGGVQL